MADDAGLNMARSAIAGDLEAAFHIADLADEVAQRLFTGGPIAHQTKQDGSPVSGLDPL
jgi:hypothetical protein